jgi:uncharacterized protein (DUF697 family)
MDTQTSDAATSSIILKHTIWAMAAGLIPLPLVDLAAVTAIQIDMIKQLAEHHGRDYNVMSGKAFVGALTGSGLAMFGASVIKTIPVIGSVVGGVSVPVFAGASTWAVGQMATEIFASGSTLEDADMSTVKEAYRKAYDKGKKVVSEMQEKNKDTFAAIERLHDLKEKGAISEAEYEAQKQKLLERL